MTTLETHELENYTVNIYNDVVEEDGIIYFARDIDADMIALSTHGRSGLMHLLSGSIAEDVVNKNIEIDNINEELLTKYLTTCNVPDPELLIRTSGECRISNFLLWQIAYSELYFTNILWPDFRKENLFQAIMDYQNRERRFGLTSEQLNN